MPKKRITDLAVYSFGEEMRRGQALASLEERRRKLQLIISGKKRLPTAAKVGDQHMGRNQEDRKLMIKGER